MASAKLRPALPTNSLFTIAAATSGSELVVSEASMARTSTVEAAVSMSSRVEKIEPPSVSSMSPADCKTSSDRARLLASLGTATVSPCWMSATSSYSCEYRPSG